MKNFCIMTAGDVTVLRNKAIALGLDDCGVFSEYSDDELAEIYNGVGPDRFPAWLRDLLTDCNPVILPGVLIHDAEYFRGGDEEAFRAANTRLGENCRRCVNSAYGKFSIVRLFYLAKISLFVKLCNKYGKAGWKFTDSTEDQ